jgi:hypothetical protein
MLTDFHKWEENREETMGNQEAEGQINEEQQPEYNINGTALNEI